MAKEVSISISIGVSKGGAQYQRNVSFTSDMAGDNWCTGTQDVGTTSEALVDNTDIGTQGWVYLKNCGTDPALWVDFGHDDPDANSGDDAACRLYGGEACIFKTAGITELEAESSSGTQLVEFAIFEL